MPIRKNPFTANLRQPKPSTAMQPYDPNEDTIREAAPVTPAGTSRAQFAPQGNPYASFDPGWRTPVILPASAMPPMGLIDEPTANKARRYIEQGYKLPEGPTGMPIMPDDPQYANYMDRTDVTEVQRARYKQIVGKDMPYHPAVPQSWREKPGTPLWNMPATLQTAPNSQTLIGQQASSNVGQTPTQQTPLEKEYGLPPDPARVAAAGPTPFYDRGFPTLPDEQPLQMTKDTINKFNSLYAREASKRGNSFKDLADYDQWFSKLFDKVPGAIFQGDRLREQYYMKNMPKKIRDEYTKMEQEKQARTMNDVQNAEYKRLGLDKQFVSVNGKSMEIPGYQEAETRRFADERRKQLQALKLLPQEEVPGSTAAVLPEGELGPEPPAFLDVDPTTGEAIKNPAHALWWQEKAAQRMGDRQIRVDAERAKRDTQRSPSYANKKVEAESIIGPIRQHLKLVGDEVLGSDGRMKRDPTETVSPERRIALAENLKEGQPVLEAVQNAGISLQDTPEMQVARRKLREVEKRKERADRKGDREEIEAQGVISDGLEAKLARLESERNATLTDMVYRDGKFVKGGAAEDWTGTPPPEERDRQLRSVLATIETKADFVDAFRQDQGRDPTPQELDAAARRGYFNRE